MGDITRYTFPSLAMVQRTCESTWIIHNSYMSPYQPSLVVFVAPLL